MTPSSSSRHWAPRFLNMEWLRDQCSEESRHVKRLRLEHPITFGKLEGSRLWTFLKSRNLASGTLIVHFLFLHGQWPHLFCLLRSRQKQQHTKNTKLSTPTEQDRRMHYSKSWSFKITPGFGKWDDRLQNRSDVWQKKPSGIRNRSDGQSAMAHP
jgi:hypothetical protein